MLHVKSLKHASSISKGGSGRIYDIKEEEAVCLQLWRCRQVKRKRILSEELYKSSRKKITFLKKGKKEEEA